MTVYLVYSNDDNTLAKICSTRYIASGWIGIFQFENGGLKNL